MSGALTSKLIVNLILDSCNYLDCALVEPAAEGDTDTDCFPTGEQLTRPAARQILLEMKPVGFVLLSIIHDQYDRISLLEPKF